LSKPILKRAKWAARLVMPWSWLAHSAMPYAANYQPLMPLPGKPPAAWPF
jgi:hypothetical protein